MSEIRPTSEVRPTSEIRPMSEIRQARSLGFPTTAALRFLPEGPISLGENRFSWVGIQHGADATTGSLNVFDLATSQNESHELPGRPGFAFACQSADTFVVGCERSLGIFHAPTGTWKPFCDGIDGDVPNTIINDGLVYEDNLIFGTKDLEFATKKAGLYLYRGRDESLIRLRDDQICSNGKAIMTLDDGSLRLIDIDSPTRQIVSYAINLDAGTLGEPTVLLDLTDDPAVPDGMILTPDGTGLIVAMFHPGVAPHGETRLYDITTGGLVCTWQTPKSPQNTCPALVRFEGKLHLVITTAVENFSAADLAQCPAAGELFVGDVQGLIDDDGGVLAAKFPV